MDFSNGIPLSVVSADRSVEDDLRRQASLFFVLIHVCQARGPRVAHQTQRHVDAVASDTAPFELEPEMLVFALRKKAASDLSFVSIGRLPGNDIVLPSERVSKFHAYVKADETGAFTLLQDGRSANGTFVDGERVQRRGEGPPTPLRNGAPVRFANLSMVTVDFDGLMKLANAAVSLVPSVVRAS